MSKVLRTGEIERALISCFFKDPGWLGEVSEMIKSGFFAYPPNQKIYAAIKALYSDTKTVDEHILISRLNLMGLSNVDGLDVSDYVSAIANMSINLDAKMGYLDELTKFYWSRQMYKKIDEAKKYIEKSIENPEIKFRDILSGTEKIVTDAVTIESVNGDDEGFIDFFGQYGEILDERVLIKDRSGIPSPFYHFNRWLGDMTFGDMIVVAAQYKVGKSTFLDCIGTHAAINGKGKVKVLALNTEMEGWRSICRDAASRTGIKEYYFNRGKFSEDQDKINKKDKLVEEISQYKGLMTYKYLPDASAERIEKTVRRWHSKYVNTDEGESALVIFDYIKSCPSGDTAKDIKEYELIGQLATSLKMLASAVKNCTILTSVQTNREGLLAQSDRINWVATSVLQLSKKTPEEIAEHGPEFGTHTLRVLATRNQGEFGDEAGPVEVMRGNKPVFESNFINYDFSNFRVEEKGTYRQIISKVGSGQLTPRVSAADARKEQWKKRP